MFAVGEAKTTTYDSKLVIPKEFGLRRPGRKIYGVWVGDWILYLSDEINILEKKVQKKSFVFEMKIDSGSQIKLPEHLNKCEATLKGCISTIEIKFK